MQLQYWLKLKKKLEENNSQLKLQTPRAQHWYNFSIGRSGVKLATLMNTRENRIGVEISMFSDDAKAFYNLLLADKDIIEEEIKDLLEWKELPDKSASRIILYKYCDPKNELDWQEQLKWLMDKTELFNKTFRERIKLLDPASWNPIEDAA